MDKGPGAAIFAALLLGWMYTFGGFFSVFASLLLLAILLMPGPNGKSVILGLIEYIRVQILGGFAGVS